MNLVVLSHLEPTAFGAIYLIASYDFFVNGHNKPTAIGMSSTRE